jgi:acetolactate synthase-1/2/3 large subunit
MKVRVADYIADYLEKLGCEACFLLSGGGMMHLLDAISRKERLHYYCNHHEQAGAMAAEAYARRSGKLGVCYATSGPGGTNTITGIVGAWQDSSPVLFVTGQSKVSQTIRGTKREGLRQFGTFEVDIVPIVESITKYAAFVDDAKSIRFHLEKACYLAMSGRRGPVLLDIPVDIQGALIDPEELPGFTPPENFALQAFTQFQIDEIFAKLKTARRPLILAGHGVRCSESVEPFRALIEHLQIPAVTTPLAADLLPYDHPLYVGHPGMKGDRPGNFAIQMADVLLVIGSSLHVTTTGYELKEFAPNCYKIFVDPDEKVLQREEVGVDLKIQSDIKPFILALTEAAGAGPGKSNAAWISHCQKLKRELSPMKEPHGFRKDSLNYYDLIDQLSERLDGTETITADAGSAFYVVGQAFRTKGQQRVIVSGALGTMGFAVPAATGCSIAAPKLNTICVTGDGSLQTNIHELATIHHNQLNVKMFIVNNDGYVSIRNTQNNFFAGHLAGTSQSSGVSFPDLRKIADAYSIPYFSARTPAELKVAMNETLATKGPAICEVFTPPQQEILPTVSSMRLPDGSMRSKPIHDMYPFMPEAELASYLNPPGI